MRFLETSVIFPSTLKRSKVWDSLRHSSTTYKLKLNHGDLKATQFMPRCICQCQREAEEQRRAAEERQRRMERIKRRKAQGLQDRYLYDYTFANDNGQNPLMDKARAYVENWKEAYRNNTGLLLFGDVGTGKSFFAGCIANALLDRDVPVLMTNFPTILNRLTGMFSEDRADFIASFDEYDLLIIDDLGVERSTEYAMEQMFFVIDSRYRSRRPMIMVHHGLRLLCGRPL